MRPLDGKRPLDGISGTRRLASVGGNRLMNALHCMAADPWSTNEVHCLGVAAGWPCRERRHSCYLYRLGAQWVMMDCGAGSSGAWREAGLDPDALDHLFLSHQHSDHVGGFSMLIQGFWVEKRRKPLTVHAPSAAIPLLRAWLEHEHGSGQRPCPDRDVTGSEQPSGPCAHRLLHLERTGSAEL
jgi:glyoxylase-like metal-dependent hydrolase (beta-lactamase superfamily II)